jgi:hypothetical protein
MPLPRVRFTVRRMMVAVAITGVTLGFHSWSTRRSDAFATLWIHHYCKATDSGIEMEKAGRKGDAARAALLRRRMDWHCDMWRKYGHASRYPWLPVPPDPPGPE